MNFKHLSALRRRARRMSRANDGRARRRQLHKPRKAVKAESVFEHQADLETIADANGGTRDTRTPGYQASVDYVVDELESYGYDPEIVAVQPAGVGRERTPALTRTDVDPDTSYVPGTAADDDSPTSTSSRSSSRRRAT